MRLEQRSEWRSPSQLDEPRIRVGTGPRSHFLVLTLIVLSSHLGGCAQIFNRDTPTTILAETNNASQGGSTKYSYRNLDAKVFSVTCIECHRTGLEFGGLNVSSFESVRRFVAPGSAATSRLYLRTFETDTFTLTSEQQDLLVGWINAGAKND